ncbi:hypothetical protein BDB01DRAFT_855413 [Pilobolus umbonatus]|nr:hypothetical protein BDB01DRAFT_855413 [Pilobolus umbonatus]
MAGRTKKGVKEDFDINHIDNLLSSTLEDVDNEDIDLNDPELLNQLQQISSSSITSNRQPTKLQRKQMKNIPMEIDLDSYTNLTVNDDIEVELNESDLTDPHLLSELSTLTNDLHDNQADTRTAVSDSNIAQLIDMGFNKEHAISSLQRYDDDLERATDYLLTSNNNELEESSPMVNTQDTANHVVEDKMKEESGDLTTWKQQASEYQKLALAAKRQGDTKKAITLMRAYKKYAQKYQEATNYQQPALTRKEYVHDLSHKDSYEKERRMDHVNESNQSVSEQNHAASPSQSTPSDINSPISPHPPHEVQELLEKVIALQKKYKEAALYYKNLGNFSAAKEMVKTSKDLLRVGVKVKNNEILDLTSVKLPASPDMNKGDGKLRNVGSMLTNDYASSIEQIDAQLKYQVNVSHNLSVHYNGKNSKRQMTGKTLDDNQDPFMQLEKSLISDHLSLSSFSKNNMPSFHYEAVEYVYKNENDHVPLNIMEFKIIRVHSLPTLGISTHLEPFIAWDFGGWPPENTAQANMNKGETDVQKGIDAEFNFTLQIPITRTNRMFLRYLQRKKLTVEVFHNKYTYGLFRRPVSLGKALIPMDQLLSKCSISGSFDLLDLNRKRTGGKVDIEINVREPLNVDDTVRRSERWIVLDKVDTPTSVYLAKAGLTQGGPYTQSSSVSNSDTNVSLPGGIHDTKDNESSRQNDPIPDIKNDLAIEPIQPDDLPMSEGIMKSSEESELETAEQEFNSVDNLVSNMVLEYELSLVNSAIASAKNKDDLIDRKQAIEIRMNMLVIQVQTGILDMETYLSQVQKRIEEDRRLALTFKKHNRLNLAKCALKRKKIMQDELDEVKAAMANQ